MIELRNKSSTNSKIKVAKCIYCLALGENKTGVVWSMVSLNGSFIKNNLRSCKVIGTKIIVLLMN